MPFSAWADNTVGEEGTDNEVDDESGNTITSTTISLTYKITVAATGAGEENAGEVELEAVNYAENNTIGALSIPHIIHNFVIEGASASIYYYTVTSIGNHAFDCSTGSSNTNADKAAVNATLSSVTIPYTVTRIGQYAFNMSSVQSVTIIDTDDTPSQLETIAMGAFYANHSLPSITLPSSVTDIQTYAFYSCTRFTSIVIPDGVTTIKLNSFGACNALETVTMNGSATLASDAFSSCTSLKSIILTGSEPSETGGSEPTSGDPAFKNDGGEPITLYVPTGSAANYLKTQWASDVENDTDVALSWNFNEIEISANAYSDSDGVYYATYYTDADGEFYTDVTTYIVTGDELTGTRDDTGTLDLAAVSGTLPEAAALLIASTASGTTYYYHPYEVGEAQTISGNMLYGSHTSCETYVPDANSDDYYFYKLSRNNAGEAGSVGFYFGAEGGAPYTTGGGKAWLAIPKSATSAKGYTFGGGEATGITAIEAATETTKKGIYTIGGVRVNDMSKAGLYIVDGKKVLVK